MEQRKGRVTIPTDLDVVKETLQIMDEWGADAIRDCDGTDYAKELKDTGAKIYATYYTTRKDNDWAKAKSRRNPADVYYECFSYSYRGYPGNPSNGSSVSGYVKGEHP